MADAHPLRAGRPRDVWLDLGWSVLLAALVLAPLLLRRGYALRGDMVFVPDQPWKDAWLGLDGAVPRFVPGDAVVWLLGLALPGDLVQRLLLLIPLVIAGVGLGRLVAGASAPARLAGIALLVWNPWTFERLSIGQWPLLVGYAALPWVALGALRLGSGGPGAPADRRGWLPLVAGLTVAALASPPSALMAAGLGVVLLAGPGRWGRAGLVAAYALVVNLPWLVPSVLAPQQPLPSGEQFAGFAVRGESPAGVVASLLSGGGIWKTSIVPDERTSAAVVLLAAALVAVALAGLRAAGLTQPPPLGPGRSGVRRLLAAGAACLALVALTAVGPVGDLLGRAAQDLPALGLLRDGHRFLAPWLLVLAVGLVGAADTAVGAASRRAGRPVAGVWQAAVGLLVAAPVLLLPSLAWGLAGDLEPVDYPAEWQALADLPPAPTVVLPWRGTYRGFAWNGYRATLDPAPRLVPGDVLLDDRHYLADDVVLASEDPLLTAVGEALDRPGRVAMADGLRELGIARVIVEEQPGLSPLDVPAGPRTRLGPTLSVVDLAAGGEVAAYDRPAPSRALVVAADLVALGVALAVFALASAAFVTRTPTIGYRDRGSRSTREGP